MFCALHNLRAQQGPSKRECHRYALCQVYSVHLHYASLLLSPRACDVELDYNSLIDGSCRNAGNVVSMEKNNNEKIQIHLAL